MADRQTATGDLGLIQAFVNTVDLQDGPEELTDPNTLKAWLVAKGLMDEAQIRQRIQAWLGHARHADTRGLRHTLFNGGWFDPWWSDGSPVEAPGALKRAVFCGAVPGTTIRGTCARPTATGTRPTTGTTTPVSEWPAPPAPEHA